MKFLDIFKKRYISSTIFRYDVWQNAEQEIWLYEPYCKQTYLISTMLWYINEIFAGNNALKTRNHLSTSERNH